MPNNRRARLFSGRLATVIAVVLSSTAAWAQDQSQGRGLEVGVWAGIVEPNRPEEATEVGFDVTFGRSLFWGIRPQVGALVTTDNVYHGFAGLRYTLPIDAPRFRVDISSAVGYYENGDGVDLGHEIEFRSGLDLMLSLRRNDYISLAIYHTSNASISRNNPGSDTILLRYVFGWPKR